MQNPLVSLAVSSPPVNVTNRASRHLLHMTAKASYNLSNIVHTHNVGYSASWNERMVC